MCGEAIPMDCTKAHFRICLDTKEIVQLYYESIADIVSFVHSAPCEKHKNIFKSHCFDCLSSKV